MALKGFTGKGMTKNFLGLMRDVEKAKACCEPLFGPAVEDSIIGTGGNNNPLRLDGDVSDPGPDEYYGTDLNGDKGWQPSPVVFNSGQAFVGGDRSAFPGWPYTSAFTFPKLGVYGVNPYIDIMVNPNSSFGIGGIAWKSLNPNYPFIDPTRLGAHTYAAMEANAFTTGGSWTSTIEFYLGNLAGNAVMTPLTIGNLGDHFYGFRNQITVDAHYRLFVGNKIRGNSPNFAFSSVDATFAADADSKPFVFLNYPNKATVDPTDQIMILDNTGKLFKVTIAALKTALA